MARRDVDRVDEGLELVLEVTLADDRRRFGVMGRVFAREGTRLVGQASDDGLDVDDDDWI